MVAPSMSTSTSTEMAVAPAIFDISTSINVDIDRSLLSTVCRSTDNFRRKIMVVITDNFMFASNSSVNVYMYIVSTRAFGTD